MNSNNNMAALAARAALLSALAILTLTACGSASDVGDQQPLAPFAKATLIGTTGPARSGSEIILTGKDSEGRSAPVFDYDWTQTGGPAVELIERSTNTVSFTVPDAADGTTLSFDLTVTDSDGQFATASAPPITVVRARDPNRFLSYLTGTATAYKVIAATNTAAALANDVRFALTVDTRITYPDRNGVERTLVVDSQAVEGSWLAATGTGGPDISAAANPRFTFSLPALDIDSINAPLQAGAPGSAQRNQILDEWKIDQAVIDVLVSLTCLDACPDPADPMLDNVLLIVADADGTTELASQANTATTIATSTQVVVDDLKSGALRETRQTAQAYYNTIDPNGERATLDDWLFVNGFDAGLPNFGADAHAVYVNNYDLGFGRDMYIRTDPVTGYVASFVTNYPSLEAAAKRLNAFVTVAMEYSPGPAGGEPFVKFYNFVPNGSGNQVRVLSMNFDGRGEKYLPGVCTACHGGAPADANDVDVATMTYPDDGNIHATFMPWDLDSFLFSSGQNADPAFTADPAIDSNALTRAAQESQFAALNGAVFCTFDAADPRYAASIDLVSGWYGGNMPDCDSGTPTFAGSFDGTYTPAGWMAQSDLYHDVYARNCRACHTQFDVTDSGGTTTQFASYDDFIGSKALLADYVYEQGVMPLARLTMDRFWAGFDASDPGAASLLAAHLEDVDDTDDIQPGSLGAPGNATGQIEGLPALPTRGETIRLDGSQSRFADTFAWNLTAPAGSASVLTGQGSDSVAFNPDVPGDYAVALTVNAGAADEVTVATGDIMVPNQPPSASPDVYMLEFATTTTLDVPAPGLLGNDADPENDAIAIPPASAFSLSDAIRTIEVRTDGSFTYTYNGDTIVPPTPPGPTDAFAYRVRDAFGADSNETMFSINWIAAPDTVLPMSPMLDSAMPSSTSAGAASEFSVALSWSGATDNVGVTDYKIYRVPARSTGPVTVSAMAGTSYVDSATLGSAELLPATDYEYTVAALDAVGNESAPASNARIATTETSYRLNIENGAADSIWADRGCTGCHGSSGGLTLSSADPAANRAEIVTDQDDEGPRVDFNMVSNSLILCKALATAAGGCTHGGPKPFLSTADGDYQTIFNWIDQGAKDN